MNHLIPVVLFAYNRPDYLKRVLGCLREDNVPLIYAFVDGPKMPDAAPRVREVREILHQVDWCEIHIVEREKNLGLGASILSGVGEVFQKHDALIVFEDDLVFVPGTYRYLCAALEYYKDDPRVMSVSGWTHPLMIPSTVTDQPYFDGRTESWSWGTWSRVWKGMDQDAMSLVDACIEKGIDIYRYGADLFEMAKVEKERNIWAVRFSYLHILHGGLCLRPPHSMVDHAGFDKSGTNAVRPSKLALKVLEKSPSIPQEWPLAIEDPECSVLWQKEYGGRPINSQKVSGSFLYAGFSSNGDNMNSKLKISNFFQLSFWIGLMKRIWIKAKFGIERMKQGVSKALQPFVERLIYLGGISERIAVKWLLRIYRSKFRLDWELTKTPPHFYDHRMGMAQFAFGEANLGVYNYYRGFFASQVIQSGDRLLDIGCGDGFFTKRFFSPKCSLVDGIDIEPSAIACAQSQNGASHIKYHLLDAVASNFPEKEYDVIVWDGAIGHFSPETLEIMLGKIAKALSPQGVFVGSESLGSGGTDHLTRFESLDDFGKLFSSHFKFVEVDSNDYALGSKFIRHEAYWRCSNAPLRLKKTVWTKYYKE